MKIYLNSNLSILEFIYLNSLKQNSEVSDTVYDFDEIKVTLVNDIHKSDYVIGCDKNDLFYGKTIIINNENFDKDNLIQLSKFNKVISRFVLNFILEDGYTLEPYEDIKLIDFRFNGHSNEVMSKLSVNNSVILKDNIGYYMKKPKMFMPTKVGKNLNILGLINNHVN